MILLHETSAKFAKNIVETRKISSITWPYPAEFIMFGKDIGICDALKIVDHEKFKQIGAFKGRGVILVFRWFGNHPIEIDTNSLSDLEENKIYNVNSSGYWHTRIGKTTRNLLRVENIIVRGASFNALPRGEKYDHQPYNSYVREHNNLIKLVSMYPSISCSAKPPEMKQFLFEKDTMTWKLRNNLFYMRSKNANLALDNFAIGSTISSGGAVRK